MLIAVNPRRQTKERYMIKYNNIKVPKGDVKISPSGLAVFYRNPKEWIDNLEGINRFNGNAATELGTCVHYIFESVHDGRTESRYWQDTEEYLQTKVDDESLLESERDEIIVKLKKHYAKIVLWATDTDESTVIQSEPSVEYKLPQSITGKGDTGYWIAGSIDAIVEDEFGEYGIRDYKTTGRKISNIDKYMMQLLTYAIAYNATVKDDTMKVTFIEVVNVNITKTKGVQFFVIKKKLTQGLLDKMKKVYKTVTTKHKIYQKNPKLRKYLFTEGVDYAGNFKLLGEEDE